MPRFSLLFRVPLALLPSLALAGCGSLPRDARNSTEKIRTSRVLTVGVSSTPSSSLVERREKQLVAKIARKLGAKVRLQKGNAHQLLQDLEDAKLPLVALQLPSDTPFAEDIGLSQPFMKHGPGDKSYCLAVAPGENRLLLMVDQTIAEETR